ncbi:MAG TPA: VWA domain-containing protein [Pyrinomonadaceae bacterium]|nr:VWA domain-containing protein [Pyrinomonadaceae bacterium]
MKSFSLFFVLAIVFLFHFSVFGQNKKPVPTATPPDDDTIKISTDLIQVDVTVTDKDGKPVTDLKPEDFEVYENDKKQTITNFSFISANKLVSLENTLEKNPAKNKNAIPIPPARLKTEQVKRTYAIVIDDLGLGFNSIYFTKQAVKKFINEQMQEGDLVAIIRTKGGVGALQSFTSDKRQLFAAIEKIKWNSVDLFGSFLPFAEKEKRGGQGINEQGNFDKGFGGNRKDREIQDYIDELRGQNFTSGTLAALGYVIRGMQQLPGRKSIMFFSEGFGHDPNDPKTMDKLRVVADMANRASVVLYTFDPRGLENSAMISSDQSVALMMQKQGLRFLSDETGGLASINRIDLAEDLGRALFDQGSYYLIGYQPDSDTFDPTKNKFNKLIVKLKRPDLKIRYRSGFFGVTDQKLEEAPKTPRQKLTASLTSPFSTNEINLSVYPIFQNDVKNGNLIQALIYIDAKDLFFATMDGGKQRASFDLLAMTFGDNGVPVDTLARTFEIELTDKMHQSILKNGLVYMMTVPIKKTGAYQFRIALSDTITNKIGSASQFIEVPDVNKRMALSNLVLDNFKADEWQKVKLDGNRNNGDRSTLLDASIRQFKRGTILYCDYVVYNPKESKQIETQMRLIKDGKVVFEQTPTSLNMEGQTDLKRLQTAGTVSLGTDMEAGSYILQVIATDKESNKKFAAQYVEFDVVE